MAGDIIGFVIYLIVGFIMIGIGMAQLKGREPVGFYSGEKPPLPENLTDVAAWNKKHGRMWLIYGGIIILSWPVGMLADDSLWMLLPMMGGVMLPIPVMIWYHNKLIREYMR